MVGWGMPTATLERKVVYPIWEDPTPGFMHTSTGIHEPSSGIGSQIVHTTGLPFTNSPFLGLLSTLSTFVGFRGIVVAKLRYPGELFTKKLSRNLSFRAAEISGEMGIQPGEMKSSFLSCPTRRRAGKKGFV
jgi:hypothetical protein